MADPQEEGGPLVKIPGCQPTNCPKFEGPIVDPNLDAANKFIIEDKTHNCCNFWQDPMHTVWVQRWKRPDSSPKVILERTSVSTTFFCHAKLPRLPCPIAEDDWCSKEHLPLIETMTSKMDLVCCETFIIVSWTAITFSITINHFNSTWIVSWKIVINWRFHWQEFWFV